MPPTLNFSRTYVRYEDDGHMLEIPIEFVSPMLDEIDIYANDTDHWTIPHGEPIAPEKRDEIMQFLLETLRAQNTRFSVQEADYLRRRAAPYEVQLDQIDDAFLLRYIDGAHILVLPVRLQPVGPMMCKTSNVTHWTEPPGEPLTPQMLSTIERNIVALRRYISFE